MVKRIKYDFLKKITKISINCGGIAENKVFFDVNGAGGMLI